MIQRITFQHLMFILAALFAVTSTTLAEFDESAARLEDEQNTIEIFEQCSPSVVYITNKALRRDFFSLNVMEIPQGTGSGFLWDNQGHIVTNYHVIHNAHSLSVTLANGQEYDAEIVGVEPNKELAVLKIDAPSEFLHPLPLGQSANLKVGQKVLAIGNPFGLDHTLTTGIVSAIGREIQSMTGRTIHHVIQTDASINPGNSGGPLLNSAGQLVGINTAIISPSGSSAGLGFAVPVDTVKRIVPQLIKFGKLPRLGLGINVLPETYTSRQRIEGIVIRQVGQGSPAELAGLEGLTRDAFGRLIIGDIIIGLDDTPIKSIDDYAYYLESKAEGDEIKITFKRGEEILETKATLIRIE